MEKNKNRSKFVGLHPVQAALLTVDRKYTVTIEEHRQTAILVSDAVIVVGNWNGSCHGKPILRVRGRLTPNLQSTKIRSFLKAYGVVSVAVVAEDNQPFWNFYRVFKKVFRWDLPDRTFLSDEVKDDIRKLYGSGKHTQNELSVKFKVSQPAIAGIVNGHSDRELWETLRADGWETLNALCEVTGAFWVDAAKKCEELNITPRVTGPRTIMVRGSEKHRLKKALFRAAKARDKRRSKLGDRRDKFFKALGITPVPSTVIKTSALKDALHTTVQSRNRRTVKQAREELFASVGLEDNHV